MYKIGELSRLCRLPVKTLRYYDSEGLLVPDRIDPLTGYRYYAAARLADCNRIIVLKELGFSLEEIRCQLRASTACDTLALLDAKEQELKNIRQRTEDQLRRIAQMRADITVSMQDMMKKSEYGDLNTRFDVVLREGDSLCVAYLRHVFPTRKAALAEMATMQTKLYGKNASSRRTVIINYETEYRETDFDMAVCVELTGNVLIANEHGYEVKVIGPMKKIAALVCRREEVETAIGFLIHELEYRNCQIVGSFYEIYYEDGTVEVKVPVCPLAEQETENAYDDKPDTFENDPSVIGKWQFVDKVPSAEQFSPDRIKYSDSHNIWLKEIYFLPNGEGYWGLNGWTKGCLFTRFGYPPNYFCHTYTIYEIFGKTYLFVCMKDDRSRICRGGQPEVYVYEKVSDKTYTKEDIRIRDNTDMPFVEDIRLHGTTWRAVDCVLHDSDKYKGHDPSAQEELFVHSVTFEEGGIAKRRYYNGNEGVLKWTKDYLLSVRAGVAEAYHIREIHGVEYLFIEWKSGDYVYGHRKPGYYVFVKE